MRSGTWGLLGARHHILAWEGAAHFRDVGPLGARGFRSLSSELLVYCRHTAPPPPRPPLLAQEVTEAEVDSMKLRADTQVGF